jgi:hypothetical protein
MPYAVFINGVLQLPTLENWMDGVYSDADEVIVVGHAGSVVAIKKAGIPVANMEVDSLVIAGLS